MIGGQMSVHGLELDLKRYHVAVVIPAYCVADYVAQVIQAVPPYVRTIVVVDDASCDPTSEVVCALNDPRVVLVRHERNCGVGGAMKTGFREALKRGAQICVKIDGDGQMDPGLVARFCQPILLGEADFVKGNRFMAGGGAGAMPFIRKLGNMGLSFIVKVASGYWRVFDPTNGYFSIRRETLECLNWAWIADDYFFETSLLIALHALRTVVRDLPLQAKYAGEPSSLRPWRALGQFPGRLLKLSVRRIWYEYFQYDFGMVSLLLLIGCPLLMIGIGLGIWYWLQSIRSGIPATGGQVMLSALPILTSVQMLIQAMALDMTSGAVKSEFGMPVPEDASGVYS